MKLVDEDMESVIDDKETFDATMAILAGDSGQAASWVGAYRPATSAEKYEKYAKWNQAHYDIYLYFIEHEMDKPGKVLELGSASGARSMLLSRYGNTVTAVEQQKERYLFAQKYNADPRVTYICQSFPGPPGSHPIGDEFDYVFCVSVLYQAGNKPGDIVKSAIDLLKPDGKLFVYDSEEVIMSSHWPFRVVRKAGSMHSVVMEKPR